MASLEAPASAFFSADQPEYAFPVAFHRPYLFIYLFIFCPRADWDTNERGGDIRKSEIVHCRPEELQNMPLTLTSGTRLEK